MRAQSKSYQKIKASISSKRSKSLKKTSPIDVDVPDFDNISEARYPLKELKIAHDGFGPNSLPPKELDTNPKAFMYCEEAKSKHKTPKRKKQKKSKSQVASEFKPPSGAFQYSDEENFQPDPFYMSEKKKKTKLKKSEKSALKKQAKVKSKKKLQMTCCKCKGVMGYDEGGLMINCPYCQTTNYSELFSNSVAVPVDLFDCENCHTKGIRPDGVEYVECICGALNYLPGKQ